MHLERRETKTMCVIVSGDSQVVICPTLAVGRLMGLTDSVQTNTSVLNGTRLVLLFEIKDIPQRPNTAGVMK